MLLNRPDEHHILVRLLAHPLQDIDHEPKRESGASASRDKHNLVKSHWVRERPVWPVKGGCDRPARVGHCILVQVGREPIVRLDGELDRVRLVDGEGVRLKPPDSWDPHEAVLSGFGPAGRLLEDDLGPTVGQRVQRGLVVNAVVQHPGGADDAVADPEGTGKNNNDEGLLAELGLMETQGDNGHDPGRDVDDVEELVPPATQKDGRQDNAQKREARDDGGHLGALGVLGQKPPLAVEVGCIQRSVQNQEGEHGVPGDLVEAVESLVRVCC